MTNTVEKASFSPQSAVPGDLPAVNAAKLGHLTAFNWFCLPAETEKNGPNWSVKCKTDLLFYKFEKNVQFT